MARVANARSSQPARRGRFTSTAGARAAVRLRWAARVTLVAAGLCLAACSGARHRKPVGPPPEYELPGDPASGEGDGGATAFAASSAAPVVPRAVEAPSDGGLGAPVLTSPDVRR